MKVFVAYGYNGRDAWVKDLVVPMLRAFRVEVVTGEQTYWGEIPSEVLDRIRSSHALLAFLTRRDKQGGEYWTTHHWVLQELAVALGIRLPVLVVRETGLDPQQGMQGGRQPIPYDEENREACLVKIVEAMGNLRFSSFEVQLLLPESASAIVGPLALQGQVVCCYRYRDGAYKSEEFRTEVEPVKGGLFAVVKGVPPDALIKFRVEASGKAWNSSFESIGSSVRLQ